MRLEIFEFHWLTPRCVDDQHRYTPKQFHGFPIRSKINLKWSRTFIEYMAMSSFEGGAAEMIVILEQENNLRNPKYRQIMWPCWINFCETWDTTEAYFLKCDNGEVSMGKSFYPCVPLESRYTWPYHRRWLNQTYIEISTRMSNHIFLWV